MKYIGIKFVDAESMTAADAVKKGYRTNDNTGDGYEVTYGDGYKSWCPKEVFEKHNFNIKNEELAKTCEGMVSPDYKERFKAEYIQLRNRLHGLKRMLESWVNGTLSFNPTCARRMYTEQADGMQKYLDVLTERAKIEDIDLGLNTSQEIKNRR